MTNLIKTQTQFVDGPNDNSLTLFLDQNNVLNVKDFQQNYNPITCYTGGGGGGGGGLIDVGEGTCSSIRINVGNQAYGQYGSALSGLANITCNDFTANTWGRNNIAHGCYSSVNGTSNIVCARQSHILSGTNNTIACDATQSAWSTQSAYSGNYFQGMDFPIAGGIVNGRVGQGNCDLTAQWPIGSTFSVTYTYTCGVTGTGSCYYGQFQMANVPVICSTYNECGDARTRLYFCYDPTLPNFIGNYPSCYTNGGGCCVTFSNGYIQKTGTFSSYSTYGASYHPNTIAGGAFNTITGYTSVATISGGYQNTISGGYGTIGGGGYNYIENASHEVIGGGFNNRLVNSSRSTIAGGRNGTICASTGSFIGGGTLNTICTSSNYSIIVGGRQNTISDNSRCSIIGGGQSNTITTNSLYSGILVGVQNTITSSPYSAILGGRNNNTTTLSDTFIVGSNITANLACALHVNNLSIRNIPTSSAGLPSGAVWSNAGVLTIVP